MISIICFSLSTLCLAAMFTPGKSTQTGKTIDTYYVGDAEPLPTWQRKTAATARDAVRVG